MSRFLRVFIMPWLLFSIALFCVDAAGADHIHIRNHMINSQLDQLEGAAVLVVGDSIVESWLAEPVGACRIINAGLGGGGVNDVMDLLSGITKKTLKFSGVILAIGVNDARRRELPADYVMFWKKAYQRIVDIALELSADVAVSTILPVEDGLPLGTKYFDSGLIDEMNGAIRQTAKRKNIKLIDGDSVFRSHKWAGHYTVDGVHLTVDAYKIFTKEFRQAVPTSCYLFGVG